MRLLGFLLLWVSPQHGLMWFVHRTASRLASQPNYSVLQSCVGLRVSVTLCLVPWSARRRSGHGSLRWRKCKVRWRTLCDGMPLWLIFYRCVLLNDLCFAGMSVPSWQVNLSPCVGSPAGCQCSEFRTYYLAGRRPVVPSCSTAIVTQ